MTFESAVSTTWGEFLAAIRDSVSGMANWSLYDTSTNGDAASLAKGEWFVFETPTGEHIRFLVDHGGRYDLAKEYGPAWDSANGVWSDRYPSDTDAMSTRNTNDYNTQSNGPALPVDTSTGMSESDPVTYWAEYVDNAGFAFYVQREAGDGADGDIAFAFAEVSQTWDYDTAQSRESDYAFTASGCVLRSADYTSSWNQTNTSYHTWNSVAESGNAPNTGWGMVNPDSNYSNFVYTDSVCRSSSYRNTAGEDIIIGSHNLLLDDRSGGDSSHQDTTQDDTGANVYTLLGRDYAHVAMRMD